ncbi:ribonuclease H-like domain-containing protein [Tanacetum coccineum]
MMMRVYTNLNNDQKSQSDSSSSSMSGSDMNTADFLVVNPENDAYSIDDIVATQNEEVATLEENIFSEELPKDKKAIGSKWIYKIKYRPSGEVDRYKARLVAQGFGQKKVIDIDEGICLNQMKYVLDLLSDYGMLTCKPAKTPLMSNLAIFNEASDNDPILDNITDYQKLMGKLIYLTNTRLDISYDVHCLSQFMHSLLKSHLRIAFKILRYLKSCPNLGIHIVKNYGMSLNAYSNADWA